MSETETPPSEAATPEATTPTEEPVVEIVMADSEPAEPFEPTIDELGRTYATGKRKNAIARVWLKEGSGQISINKKPSDSYFGRPVLKKILNHPFEIAECEKKFDAVCSVKGGGLSGQAGALRHGISKALALRSFEMRKLLKAEGFLTRDSRVVERKKYGRRKARRSFQFSKR